MGVSALTRFLSLISDPLRTSGVSAKIRTQDPSEPHGLENQGKMSRIFCEAKRKEERSLQTTPRIGLSGDSISMC